MSFARLASTFLTAIFLLPLVGCSKGDQPDLGEVSGTITLDGEPLGGASVYFRPKSGGRTSTGATDANGVYVMTYKNATKGAKIGEHTVTITTASEAIDRETGKPFAEQVPAKYNEKSELTADVQPGSNPPINFELQGRLKRK